MSIFQINPTTCTKCGICAKICPANVIIQPEGKYPTPHRAAEVACLRCGHCVAACPSGSVIHRDVPLENCPTIDTSFLPDFEQISLLIKNRRSVRFFLDKPVPREIIEKALEVGRYAPTVHNNQTVNWLVIDNPAELKHITDVGIDWIRSMIEQEPMLSKYYGFPHMVKEYEKGVDKFLMNAPVLCITYAKKSNTLAFIDCVNSMTYFNLAATGLKLGCCWAGFLYTAASSYQPMTEALAIPEKFRVFGGLMVGYQRYQYYRIPKRKPANIIWR